MIRVAKIINTRGLKGECKLWLYTDEPEARFEKGAQFELDDGRVLTVEKFTLLKGLGYAFFKEIQSVEEAEKLRGAVLGLEEEDLPEPEEGEYYYHQLQDARVINEQGEELGTVSEIMETGAHLVLRVSNGEKSFLVPFVEAFVGEVDPKNKVIEIKEMEGLR